MEPWLTGKLAQDHPIRAALLYSFEHARSDLRRHTGDLNDEAIWRSYGHVAPVGFHIRHIAGSVERLMTYTQGEQLTEQQLHDLKAEEGRELTKAQLFDLLETKLAAAEVALRRISVDKLDEVREIGRNRIPVPLGVLLVHIAEHTQRHVGAAIVTAKLARG